MDTQSHNPFDRWGRIHSPDELFDREAELRLLRRYVTNGMSCQVIAPAGYGKSSLLYSLKKFVPEWDKRFIISYVDLQDPESHTVSGFMKNVWTAWEDAPSQPTLIMLAEKVQDLSARKQRFVLCLDEFEECTRRPEEFTADFFLSLRSIAQGGMVIITASRDPLRVLVPGNNPASPFFNIFAMLRLGPFPRQVAEHFIALARPGVPPFTAEERQVMLDFAQGHPLTLQVACFHVLEAKKIGEDLSQAIQKAADAMQHQQALS